MPDELAHLLLDWGCDVIGPATSVISAHYLSSVPEIDGVLFDMHLGREMIFPVAAKLLARNIPFLFLTAFPEHSALPAEFHATTLVAKPVDPMALQAAMRESFIKRSRDSTSGLLRV